MGFFSSDSNEAQNHEEIYNGDGQNKSSWSHEAVGGAAAFEAVRLYEQKAQRDGKPQSHALAKEILAGLIGAEVDKLAETKGLDFVDREKAKRHAQQQASQAVASDFQ